MCTAAELKHDLFTLLYNNDGKSSSVEGPVIHDQLQQPWQLIGTVWKQLKHQFGAAKKKKIKINSMSQYLKAVLKVLSHSCNNPFDWNFGLSHILRQSASALN